MIDITSATETIILSLHDIGAVRFGSFRLKSGLTSPLYLDLRLIVSHPLLLQAIGDALANQVANSSYDLLCGVPYTALPIATAMSLAHEVPMVLRRKEKKDYGTKRMIEGSYQPEQRCLVVEDLVTSGGSVLETISLLEQHALRVRDVAAVIDREQGASKRLAEAGYQLHTLCTLSELLDCLVKQQRIEATTRNDVITFIKSNQI